MKLWIEFLNLLNDENIYFETPFFHGKIKEDNKEITWEIGFDESGDNILIVFEDAKYTVQIRIRELLDKAREFATGKTMWHKKRKNRGK